MKNSLKKYFLINGKLSMEEFRFINLILYTGCLNYNENKKYWFRNGKIHRDGGPAVIYSNGYKVWYKNGFIHREDGPAIMYGNYSGLAEYWLENKRVG